MTGHAADANRVGATPVTAPLAVLSGPSGVGKSTVMHAIRQHFPSVWLSVSVTTRAPRRGESHGVEYLFVSDPEFDKMVADGDLLEWAEFAGKRYGTPRPPVMAKLSAGVPALLEIEPSGARQIRRAVPGALLVYLASPSQRPPAGRELQAAAMEADVLLVNTSLPDVCRQLVALVTAHATSQHGLGRYMPVRAESAQAGQACPDPAV